MGLGTSIIFSLLVQTMDVCAFMYMNTASNLLQTRSPYIDIEEPRVGQDIPRKWPGSSWKTILPPIGSCWVPLLKRQIPSWSSLVVRIQCFTAVAKAQPLVRGTEILKAMCCVGKSKKKKYSSKCKYLMSKKKSIRRCRRRGCSANSSNPFNN